MLTPRMVDGNADVGLETVEALVVVVLFEVVVFDDTVVMEEVVCLLKASMPIPLELFVEAEELPDNVAEGVVAEELGEIVLEV